MRSFDTSGPKTGPKMQNTKQGGRKTKSEPDTKLNSKKQNRKATKTDGANRKKTEEKMHELNKITER